mmetsp:Transcript_1891/g.2718  ORF Transcript_1891/g.2718 Transcript_1891/m.2718 type:complete len:1249 (-) Transcript_1891:42-3788(-)
MNKKIKLSTYRHLIVIVILISQCLSIYAQTCYGIDKASSTVCSGKGTCISTDTCVCHINTYGTNCANQFDTLLPISAGENGKGQLGNGQGTGFTTIEPVHLNPSLGGVYGTAIGGQTSFGLVYNTTSTNTTGYGWGEAQALGINQAGSGAVNVPTKIVKEFEGRIFAMATGYQHTVLAVSDKIYGWGLAQNFQLGQPSVFGELAPREIAKGNLNAAIIQITCGVYHTSVLVDTGRVFSQGTNIPDAILPLGIDTSTNSDNPIEVFTQIEDGTININSIVIKQIAASSSASCAIDVNGVTYCWGGNTKGEIGQGTIGESEFTYRAKAVVTTNIGTEKAAQLCGGGLSQALSRPFFAMRTETGKVFMWGDNSKNQQALADTNAHQSVPHAVAGATNINTIGCGYSGVVTLTNNVELFYWGEIGSYVQVATPTNVSLAGITVDHFVYDIEAGTDHLMLSSRKRPVCFQKIDYNPQVCSTHGSCVADNECNCEANYFDIACNVTTCYGVLSNTTATCSANGTCDSFNNCQCNTNYTGNNCQFPMCYGISGADASVCTGHGECGSVNQCICEENYSGSQCEVWTCNSVDRNNGSVCSGHGACIGSNSCNCTDPYYGPDCEVFKCYDVPSNSTEVCGGHGTCAGPNACTCANSSYSGLNCSTFQCFDASNHNPQTCNGQGTCVDINTCQCNANYSGSNCTIPLCFNIIATDPSICNGRGNCTAPQVCTCDSSYGGSQCEIPVCFDKLASNSTVCSGQGTCSSPNQCTCNDKRHGSQCELFECYGIVSNATNVCSGHGTCVSPETCSCERQYVGDQCNTFTCFGVASTDAGVCSGHGTCTAIDTCQCVNDGSYTGTFCNITSCNGIPLSNSSTCSGHGTCGAPNSCTCSDGYTGPNCEYFTCQGISQTDSSACNGHGNCTGVNECQCDTFYFGNVCNIPSCNGTLGNETTVCSGNGACTNPNDCTCSLGWEGDLCDNVVLPTCFNVSHVLPTVCNGHGQCTTTDSCSCSSGYYGEACANEIYSCNGIQFDDQNVCNGRGTCVSADSCVCSDSENYGGTDCETCITCFPVWATVLLSILGVIIACCCCCIIILLIIGCIACCTRWCRVRRQKRRVAMVSSKEPLGQLDDIAKVRNLDSDEDEIPMYDHDDNSSNASYHNVYQQFKQETTSPKEIKYRTSVGKSQRLPSQHQVASPLQLYMDDPDAVPSNGAAVDEFELEISEGSSDMEISEQTISNLVQLFKGHDVDDGRELLSPI